MVVHIDQAVFCQAVHQFAIAVFVTPAGIGHIVGYLRHVFHATRYYDIIVSQHNALSPEGNALHAGGADFVDGSAGNRIGNARETRCLARRRLTQIGAHDVAHQHFVHFFGGNTRFFQCATNGCCTQLSGGNSCQTSAETANGCANSGDYVYFLHVEIDMVRLIDLRW